MLLARFDDEPTLWDELVAGEPGAFFVLNILLSILTAPAWLWLLWLLWKRYTKPAEILPLSETQPDAR